MKSLHDIVDLEGYHQIQDFFIQKCLIPKILMLAQYLDPSKNVVFDFCKSRKEKIDQKTKVGTLADFIQDVLSFSFAKSVDECM